MLGEDTLCPSKPYTMYAEDGVSPIDTSIFSFYSNIDGY
jgi:hypothetical protein